MMSWTNRKTTVSSRGAPGRGASGREALGSRVLAHRNPAVVAVGAWVESGTELWKHPAEQASLTEQLQEERRRRNERDLCDFQENVRYRVAEQEKLRRRDKAWPQVRSASRADSDTQGTAQDGPEGPVCEGPLLWPLDHTEELRRQRQAHFLMQRKLFLSKDRQNVKENREHQKHLLKTAGLKGQKEHWRLEEERRLGEALLWSRALESLEQREQQVVHTLHQEGAAETVHTLHQEGAAETVHTLHQEGAAETVHTLHQEGAAEVRERRRHMHLPKSTRQMNSLRAQVETLFPGAGRDLPPLCCCGSFWESHPDTCANNCVFYNDPEAYVQALQTVVHCWELL